MSESLDPGLVGEAVLRAALGGGFEEAAASVERRSRNMVRIANSQPSVSQSWESLHVDLYLARGGRLVQASLEIRDPGEMERILAGLSRGLEGAERSFIYAPLPDPDPSARPLEGGFDSAVEKILNDPSDAAEAIINKAHSEGAERAAGVLDLGISERCVSTTKGFDMCERKTWVAAHLRAFRGDGSGHWGHGSRLLDLRILEETASRAARYADLSRRPRPVEPGKRDLVLSPMVFGELLGPIGRAFSAFSYMTGLSFMAGRKPGDAVASEILTIKDSPLRADLIGSAGFDDEGQATRTTALVERGIFRSLLHNTKTAAAMGSKSTGNAGWIYPRPWALTVEPGDRGEEDLIKDLREGLVVTNSWYTRFNNVAEGVFSTVSRDALLVVENGEMVGAGTKIRIADTLGNLLRNAEALGKKAEKVMWWEIEVPVEAPFILVRNVNTSK